MKAKRECSHGAHCGNDGWGNEWHESDDCPLSQPPEPEPAPTPTYWQERIGWGFLQTSRGGWVFLFVVFGLPILLALLYPHGPSLDPECLQFKWAC